jgi:acetyl-CoA synthetase
MSNADTLFEPPAEIANAAWVDAAAYARMYEQSIRDPEGFWAEHGRRIDWIEPYTRVRDTSFRGDVHIRWFYDGKLNVSANCIDRHLADKADRTAIIWEGDDPAESRHITYRELHEQVSRFANVLKAHGVGKGDRVTIYLPMIPEAAYAMLACARIGAIHSVVFGGFSPDSLRDRILDGDSRVLITADEGLRGGRKVPLKKNADEALASCPAVRCQIVVRRTGGAVDWTEGRDFWWHEECAKVSAECPPEPMGAEDPLFILYTSGSTGKPKGVLHTSGGYLVFASMTHQYVFDYKPGEIYWCTADVGWVTGHSYIVYGPLANGATTLMFEGVQLSERVAVLGGRRQAQGQHLLHRADGDPGTDARRRRPGEADQPREPAHPGFRRGADQSGGVAVVPPRRRRRPLPGRRHVVADGDRRRDDHAAAGRDRGQTRIGDQAVLRREARHR